MKKWCFLKPTSFRSRLAGARRRRPAEVLDLWVPRPGTRTRGQTTAAVVRWRWLKSSGNFLPELLQLRRRPPWALLSQAAAEQVC